MRLVTGASDLGDGGQTDGTARYQGSFWVWKITLVRREGRGSLISGRDRAPIDRRRHITITNMSD